MLSQSVLHQTAMSSEIAGASMLRPEGSKGKRTIAADLLLTALIDAFSILVIFLLMNFSSTGEIIFMSKDMELPKARAAEVLERNPVVKLEGEKIFLEEKEISVDSLVGTLVDLKKKLTEMSGGNLDSSTVITIQADRRQKYQALNQIVLACAHAGFSDIRFAVLMK